MKSLPLILVCSMLSVPYGYAGSDKSVAPASVASTQRTQLLKRINDFALSDKGGNREALEVLEHTLRKDIEELEVDADLLEAARDKKLDWKTRFLILERIERGAKKIDKDRELTLYSDVLADNSEHDQVRKRAAEALMKPARTEPKARKALEKAATDKALPADVLRSVMVSVGFSGLDDVDTLAELMKRPAKTNNEIGINLNAVRALGKSKDPRAVGMLFEILDRSQPDSFFNMTALEQLSFIIRRGPEQMEKLRPMLTPRLLKLLDDRSRIGASRQTAARMLLRMNERKAIPQILKWVKPKEEGGGGHDTDMKWAFDILAEFQAKEVTSELQKVIDNVPNDTRWVDGKTIAERNGRKFPDSLPMYISLQECLKKLKGEPYNKKYVSLPLKYD
jgi:hypothetical protein